MSPLGKFTLAVLGLRLAGANGFLWGMLLGHLFIDNTGVIHKIESAVSQVDDNIRLMLPYNVSRSAIFTVFRALLPHKSRQKTKIFAPGRAFLNFYPNIFGA